MTSHIYYSDIITVFDGLHNRNIEYLSTNYQNDELLLANIRKLFLYRGMAEKIEGKRILLKPNWVKHNNTATDEICLRTHDCFLLAALEIVLSFAPHSVMIADAPIQGAKWEQIVRAEFVNSVVLLSEKFQILTVIKDFRRVTFDSHSNTLTMERNPMEKYVIFDLGKISYLEPITHENKKLFRVTDYDPDRLSEAHRNGIHKYCIAKDVFDAEIVITVPKVKTHQKAGLTNALKILVGINGDKDYLPHHRKGGTGNGGDCYPGNNLLRNISENILDAANRRRGKRIYKLLLYLSILFWKSSFPTPKHDLAAAWHGNDTTWRMTLDINLIAQYGKADGTISQEQQREIYSLSDGIIGGQGDGPLKPDPLPLGIICFSNCSSLTDAAMAILMGFNIEKISLVNEALKMDNNKTMQVTLNGEEKDLTELRTLAIPTTPPPGWVGYL